MEFTRQEINDIILSTLSIACTLIVSNLFLNLAWIGKFFMAAIIVSASLIIKLFIQKRVAEKYDCEIKYAFDYSLFIVGILIAFASQGSIIFAVMGGITASSAFVSRLGHKYVNITQRERGLINLSGLMANIVLALISLLLYPLSNDFFQLMLNVNIYMALFALIPIPPLDGSKVFWWNRLVWLISFIIALFMFFMARTVLFSIIGIILLVIVTFVLWEKMF